MKNLRLVDFESHYMPQSLIEMAAARDKAPRYDVKEGLFYMSEGADRALPIMPGLSGIEDRITVMDRAGIDLAVLSGSPLVEQMEPELGIAAAVASNNELFEIKKKYPGRFECFACLPVRDAAASAEELRRCRDELGFKGWLTFSSSGDIYADGDEMFPIFAEAERLGMFVYVHPTHSDYKRLYGCGGGLSSAGLGFTVDACVGIMRMITRGLFDRLPELKLIIGHMGEGLPFTMKRMDDHIGGKGHPNAGANIHIPSYYFKRNIWLTTGGNDSPEAFDCAKAVLGAERLLFSTDYPFESAEKTVKAVENFDISPAEREMLYSGNAKRFFNV